MLCFIEKLLLAMLNCLWDKMDLW